MLQTWWSTNWRFTPRIRKDLNSGSVTRLALRRWGFRGGLRNFDSLHWKAATEIGAAISFFPVAIYNARGFRQEADGGMVPTMLPTNDAIQNAAGKPRIHRRGHAAFPDPADANLPLAAGDTLRARSHRAMGTEFVVYLDVQDDAQARACFDAVFDEIDRLEITFSRFQCSSELSRLNRHAAEGPVVTDP